MPCSPVAQPSFPRAGRVGCGASQEAEGGEVKEPSELYHRDLMSPSRNNTRHVLALHRTCWSQVLDDAASLRLAVSQGQSRARAGPAHVLFSKGRPELRLHVLRSEV